jgi:hypothetical protein
MNKQNGASTRSGILRTDRLSTTELLATGAGAASAIAYMAAGMPTPTGVLGVAAGTALGATAIGLMVADVVAEWRRPVPPPVAPVRYAGGSLRVVAGRTLPAPMGALTCENEVLRDPRRRTTARRTDAPTGVLSGGAVPAHHP